MRNAHLLPNVLAVLADGSRCLPPTVPVRAVVEALDFLAEQGLVRTSPNQPGMELTSQGWTLHQRMQRCHGASRGEVWYWDGEDFDAGTRLPPTYGTA